jgi:electron transfer flavoprotein beta subunit
MVTVTAGVVEVRYPSFKGIMAAKGKPLEELKIADLGIDASSVGWAGGGQKINEVINAESRASGEIIEDDGESHHKIIAFLEQLKVI